MKRIIYATPKENIEVAYPDWCEPLMKLIWKYLKLRIVKSPLNRGAKIKAVWIDEMSNI